MNGAELLWIKLWKLWIPVGSYCVAGLGGGARDPGPWRSPSPGLGWMARLLTRAVPALTVARARLVR